MAIFRKPEGFDDLARIIDHCVTLEAVIEVTEYAIDVARRENYPDPIQQAECWMEDAPFKMAPASP